MTADWGSGFQGGWRGVHCRGLAGAAHPVGGGNALADRRGPGHRQPLSPVWSIARPRPAADGRGHDRRRPGRGTGPRLASGCASSAAMSRFWGARSSSTTRHTRLWALHLQGSVSPIRRVSLLHFPGLAPEAAGWRFRTGRFQRSRQDSSCLGGSSSGTSANHRTLPDTVVVEMRSA